MFQECRQQLAVSDVNLRRGAAASEEQLSPANPLPPPQCPIAPASSKSPSTSTLPTRRRTGRLPRRLPSHARAGRARRAAGRTAAAGAGPGSPTPPPSRPTRRASFENQELPAGSVCGTVKYSISSPLHFYNFRLWLTVLTLM